MKKALGILFILIGTLLTIICIYLFFSLVRPDVVKLIRDFNANQLGTVIGLFIGEAIFGIPAILLFIFGIKWIRLPFKRPNPNKLPEFPSRITDRNSSI